MMRPTLLLSTLLAIAATQAPSLHGLNSSETAFTFGKGSSVGNSVLPLRDGGLVAAGYTTGGQGGGEDVLVVRTDAAGKALWSRTVGGPGDDTGWAIAAKRGGGFLVCGYTSGFGAEGEDVLLVGLGDNGDVEWTKVVGGPGNQRAWAMAPVDAGTFAIAAQSDRGPGGGWDALVLKIDEKGGVVWTRGFGGAGVDRLFGVAAMADGSVVVTGSTSAPNAPLDTLAARLTPAGAIAWEKRFGGAKDDVGHAVIATRDGGILVTGYGQSLGNGGNDAYLSKLSAGGDVLWTKTAGGADDDRAMMSVETATGYVMVGYRRAAQFDWEIWLGEFRADGTLARERAFGSTGPDRGVMVASLRNNNFAVVGQLGNTRDDSSLLLLVRVRGLTS